MQNVMVVWLSTKRVLCVCVYNIMLCDTCKIFYFSFTLGIINKVTKSYVRNVEQYTENVNTKGLTCFFHFCYSLIVRWLFHYEEVFFHIYRQTKN